MTRDLGEKRVLTQDQDPRRDQALHDRGDVHEEELRGKSGLINLHTKTHTHTHTQERLQPYLFQDLIGMLKNVNEEKSP
jgi:hypothetical protein